MINNDYLFYVTEEQMENFLKSEDEFCEVYSVVKFFDESYNGYVFQVRLNGLEFLPREEGGFLRFGKFGLIKDDETNFLPTAYDNIEEMLNHLSFFKNYVSFINESLGNKKFLSEEYLRFFKNNVLYSVISDNHNKQQKLSNELKERKSFIKEVLNISQVEEKGL